MLKKVTAVLVGSIMLVQGLITSPVFAQAEQYEYERTKINYSVQEVEQRNLHGNVSVAGRFEDCKVTLLDALEKKYGRSGFGEYVIDQNTGNISGVKPYSVNETNLRSYPILYRQQTNQVLYKYAFELIEMVDGGSLYMMSQPMNEVSTEGYINIQKNSITSSAAIHVEPSIEANMSMQLMGKLIPIEPPKKKKNDYCEITCKIYAVNVVSSLSPIKEKIIAGANDYPLDGIMNGYYYKRLSAINNISPPLINEVQIKADTRGFTVSLTTGNIAADLDAKPYQIIINNKASNWWAKPYFEVEQLLPNKIYAITVRLKGINGKIVEKKFNKATLAEKPNIEITKLTFSDIRLKITDENPVSTKYQIKIGEKYVLENGQMSPIEQWILIPSQQITIIENLTEANSKISVKAKNEDNVVTTEAVTQGVSPSKGEQYSFERTKVSYSVKEVAKPKYLKFESYPGLYSECKDQILASIKSYFGTECYESYSLDLFSGILAEVSPYSLTTADLLTGIEFYIKKTDQQFCKYVFGIAEVDSNGKYLSSKPPYEEMSGIKINKLDSIEMTSQSVVTDGFIHDPVVPVRGNTTEVIYSKTDVNIAWKFEGNKEIIIAGAGDYPMDGHFNGYYYKRLSTVRTVPLPVINDVNVKVEPNMFGITILTDSLPSDLDSSPYKFIVNGVETKWQTSPYYEFNSKDIAPNTSCKIVVMLKGLNDKVVEKTLYKMTLAEKPNLEVTKLSNTILKLRILDKNPASTKYQIKIGEKYVLENGQMSATEQWIAIPTKEINVIENLTATNSKVSIKAKNDENVPSSETILTLSPSLINYLKVTEGTYAIKLKLSPSVATTTLDKAPYQFVVNGQATEWGKLPYYTVMNLQPSSEYKLIGRIKDSNGFISEIEVTGKTLSQEQNLTFTYDNASMLMGIEQQNSSDSFYYDSLGNLILKLFTTK